MKQKIKKTKLNEDNERVSRKDLEQVKNEMKVRDQKKQSRKAKHAAYDPAI